MQKLLFSNAGYEPLSTLTLLKGARACTHAWKWCCSPKTNISKLLVTPFETQMLLPHHAALRAGVLAI